MPQDAPPGWYPDSSHGNRLRYWDGTAWTGHFADSPDPIEKAPPTGGDSQPSTGRSRRTRSLVTIAAVCTLLLAGGGLGLSTWLGKRASAEAQREHDRALTERFCERLEADRTLLDDWHAAWQQNESVREDMLQLTASEESIRQLAVVLRDLAPRLTDLAGSQSFDLYLPGGMGHRDILNAARYASHASAAIDDWDFSDTRYRILVTFGMDNDGEFGSTSFGSNALFHEVEENCKATSGG